MSISHFFSIHFQAILGNIVLGLHLFYHGKYYFFYFLVVWRFDFINLSTSPGFQKMLENEFFDEFLCSYFSFPRYGRGGG